MVSQVQIVSLAVLFALFLGVPTISKMLGSTLDLLPIRLAAVLIILASVHYDSLVSLAVFLLIAALYIHHHNNDLMRINVSMNSKFSDLNNTSSTPAMNVLHHGGHADITDDHMDFMPKRDMQDNDVDQVHTSSTVNEKYVLPSEPLGASKAQNLFDEDMWNARNLEQWTKDGSF